MLWSAGKKCFDRHIQNFCNLVEATTADTVGAFFVFLDLLKRYAELGARLPLAESSSQAVHSNIRAHKLIDFGRRAAARFFPV